MPTLLVKNIHTLVTMDRDRRELYNAAIFVRDNVIEQVGLTNELPQTANEVLDLQGKHIVLPGLVNTHHHFYQVLTKVIPAAQDCTLFNWLQALYPIWGRLTSESIYISAQMAAAELILSGCTTASDHLYIYPNDCKLDDEIAAIQEMGMRFHASRGSMSVGESQGGLPPDALVEKEVDILKDSQRLIEEYHDPSRFAMLRMTLAPCSPFSVSPDLMIESAKMARSYTSVRLHTHLAENKSDVDYSLAKFGKIPGDYAESVGWLGDDVWHAHCVKLSDDSIAKFGRTGTGVAHCPCSNDTGNLLQEARTAFLLARVNECDPTSMSAREILEVATLGGAKVLGRDDIGAIAPNMAADFIAIDIERSQFAGAHHDLVAALIFCPVPSVDYSFINGRKVVDRGQLTTLDLPTLIERTNKIARKLVD